MFSYIRGSLEEVAGDAVTVETMGIGWKILVPVSVLDRLPRTGTEIKLYTSFQVREDDMTLYGFLTAQDRRMFEMLLLVTGVGPKAAMGILSVLQPDDLRLAIIAEDAKAISRAPGIGPKTAKRIILDLKDRISTEEILPEAFPSDSKAGAAQTISASGTPGASAREAIEALVALGYSLSEATRAVREVKEAETMTAEAVLKAALKYLAF
ncbi:MAG: Holliday junction branch migration protein RuvA [Clostridiales bacterium]|nr:Holliday junction branch migration protein RuvA [Clostridiales bacterium]